MSPPRRSLSALCAVLAIAGAAHAADEALVLRMSAERLAAEGRCEDAIATARRARELAPQDAAAAAVEGRCLLDLKRYDEASRALADAKRLAPNDAEVAVEELMALYHLGNRVEAERALVDAKRLAPNDARVSLYEGLLLAEKDQQRASAEVLQRAARLDPSADPYASYYAGMAWLRANEREKAREALERAQAAGGAWGEQAAQALASLEAGGVAGKLWLRARGGIEYDSNVVLRGDNVGLPSDISRKDDGRGAWSVLVGYEAFRNHDWAVGVIGGYQGTAQFNLTDFDLQYPTVSIYFDRRVDDASFLRFQPYAGYAWQDLDPYLRHAGGELSYYRGFDEAGSGRLWTRVGYQDYLYPTQLDENKVSRDGWEYLAGYEHLLPLKSGTTLRAGVDAGAYRADGSDNDYATGGAYAGVRQELPWRFALDLSGGFDYQAYGRNSSFTEAPPLFKPDPHGNRHDEIWTAQVELERPITDWLILSGRYRYVDDNSNADPFDYERHVVGGYLTVVWSQ
ncbi:MAG TPA: tetratricopeptide repeat protein [Myxococcota bacterium]|nr:tetratricopeptide repeat protein [Myxococcota bacterium]